jgi:hypothetical protein
MGELSYNPSPPGGEEITIHFAGAPTSHKKYFSFRFSLSLSPLRFHTNNSNLSSRRRGKGRKKTKSGKEKKSDKPNQQKATGAKEGEIRFHS